MPRGPTRSLVVALAAFSFFSPDSGLAGERPHFRDVTAIAGLRFVHERGDIGRRYMVETFGGGVLVLDYDGDGFPDLYFVNGGELPGYDGPEPNNALYRNRGDGTFTDVTLEAGVPGRGYGMGGAAADIDNDGDVDIYLTSFGPNLLYRNNGDGSFTEIGVRDDRHQDETWSTSATFLDIDADGFLDLFVCDYLEFGIGNHRRCRDPVRGIESYCHPNEYEGLADRLLRNDGRGAFEDVSKEAGVVNVREAKGLGVVAADYDNDGDMDIYVANDSTRNSLYRNEGDGRLVDVGFEAGVGLNEEGLPEAGMGVDWGDVDRDGRLDVIVTNFDFETNTLYRNLGGGLFLDAASQAGLGEASLNKLGFGCDLADFDNDGWLDLVVTNGHILDNIAEIQSNSSHAQPVQYFRNIGGRFRDESVAAGPAFSRERVGRGLATLDYDRDGDLDVALANNGGPAELMENERGSQASWLGFRLVGTRSNRSAVGARVQTSLSGREYVEELIAGSSYLSQNELTIHLGMGDANMLDEVVVRWPSGERQTLGPLAARTVYIVKEGVGVLGTLPEIAAVPEH